MSIERFTREQFETALPVDKTTGERLWAHLGLLKGEHVYEIPVKGTNKRIVVRSSIDRSDRAAEAGEDSIRLWIEYFYQKSGKWHPLKKHQTRWTTRVPGWAERMTDKLRELYVLALEDSKNGRAQNAETTDKARAETDKDNGDPFDFLSDDAEYRASNGAEPTPAASTTRSEAIQSITKEPNADQLAAITAPVDAAVRVLAPPGSGKTFVIARRYTHLLENGAQPQDILAVTFNKTMADELLERIKRVNPSVAGTSAEQQVCTIHAACYRALRNVAGSDGKKETRSLIPVWQLKRTIRDLADEIWTYSEERPGWEEIDAWVCSAKAQGLTSADDLSFFTETLTALGEDGNYHGPRLHELRRRLDLKMRAENVLTFADMLLDTEIKLKRDATFRNTLQTMFKHVIIDEAQDVGSQALRILITLSFDPPANPVYGKT